MNGTFYNVRALWDFAKMELERHGNVQETPYSTESLKYATLSTGIGHNGIAASLFRFLSSMGHYAEISEKVESGGMRRIVISVDGTYFLSVATRDKSILLSAGRIPAYQV